MAFSKLAFNISEVTCENKNADRETKFYLESLLVTFFLYSTISINLYNSLGYLTVDT